MVRQLNSKRGSALGWVVMTTMVMIMCLILCLTIAIRYSSENSSSHGQVQADLTAKSIAHAIAADMGEPLADGSIRALIEEHILLEDSFYMELNGLDATMGQVYLDVTHQELETSITVAVHTVLELEEVVVVVEMKRNPTEDRWEVLEYGNNVDEEVLR